MTENLKPCETWGGQTPSIEDIQWQMAINQWHRLNEIAMWYPLKPPTQSRNNQSPEESEEI